MRDIEKYKNQIRNMTQYKGLSDEELTIVAEKKIAEEDIINSLTFCIDDIEKKFAVDLINRYLSQSSFENEADKDTLKQLIDTQLLVERIKAQLKKEYEKANPGLPIQMIEQLRETEAQILELKEKLGLTTKDRQEASWVEEWNKLKKKALKYAEEHKGCNVVKCPYCQKMYLLLIRTEHLTSEKCTWFKGTILYNKQLFNLLDTKRISEDELADILGVSKFYVTHIYNNLYLKEKAESDRENK